MARRKQPSRAKKPRPRAAPPPPPPEPAPAPPPAPSRDGLLSTIELGLALGLTKDGVHKMRRRGCKPKATIDGAFYWDLAEVVAWREKNLHAPPSGPEKQRAKKPATPGVAPVPAGTNSDYSQPDPLDDDDGPVIGSGMPRSVIEADLRLKYAREQMTLLDVKKRSGELVPVQEVREAWSRRVATAKRLLESLPPSIAQDVCAACGIANDRAPRIERVIGDAFGQVMQRLTDMRSEEL